jgi:glutathione S-transferase
MDNIVTFYTHPQSRGRMVHWLLEELGAPYDMKILDFDKREHKAPSYLAINPMGKVPAIVHRGVVVTEVAAIGIYLADAFPKAGLAPALDDPKRGTYLRWFIFGTSCFEPAVIDKVFARPAVRPGALGYGTYEDMLAAVTGALKPGPFILGERFSAVDVYVGSQIQYAIMTKGIESTPVFEQYINRWATRPALQRVLAGTKP